MIILFANFIQSVGEQLKIRQQVIATATGTTVITFLVGHSNGDLVFFRRFYLKNSLSDCDPLLMAPTCLFLASKVEEIGPMSNNRLVNATSQVVKHKYRQVFSSLPTGDYQYRTK